MSTKAANEAHHFKIRLHERYGIDINRFAYRELCLLAKTGKMLKKQSNRTSIKEIEYTGIKIIVVYDKKRVRLVTCLTAEQYAKNKDKCHLSNNNR